MSEMYKVVGTSTPTALLEDPQGAEAIAVPMKPGQGTVAAGTVIYRDADGFWNGAAAANIVGTNMLAVLAEDVDTDVSETVAEDAAAYRSARLIDGKVKDKTGTAVTAAHKVILRQQNLVLKPDTSAAVFDNTVSA